MNNNEYFSSINEVSKKLDLPAHTLRYWEKQFPVVIKPTTGAGGRRYYRHDMVTTLEIIKDLLYDRGMTIAGVKKLLKDGKFPKTVDYSFAIKTSVPDKGASTSPEDSSALFGTQEDIVTAIDLLVRAQKELQQ